MATISNHTHFEGIRCEVRDFELHTKTLSAQASFNGISQNYNVGHVDISVPIGENIPAQVGGGIQKGSSASINYNQNYIKVSGNLKLDVAEGGVIRGVSFEGGHVEGDFRNLVVETLQDVVKERMRGFNVSVGMGAGSKLGGEFTHSTRDGKWSEAVGRIIGTQTLNLIVKESLEVTGGILARAEIDASGNLIDKGDANIEAATVTVKKLYDYDKGKTLGIGLYFVHESKPTVVSDNNNGQATAGGEWKVGDAPIKYSFAKSERERNAVINCNLKAQQVNGNYEKSTAAQVSETRSVTTGSIDANIPVGDIIDSLASKPADTKKAAVDPDNNNATGVASGEGSR